MNTPIWHLVELFGAAFAAGAVNSVAGGGTLLTFPTLLALGVPATIANATNTVALWPGTLSSLWSYRREIGGSSAWLASFGGVSLVGGSLGASLLLTTRPGLFDALVPYLILLTSLLFIVQQPISRWLGHPSGALSSPAPITRSVGDRQERPCGWLPGLLFQFAVAIYGGYFGAGIGILMLAALGLMGMDQIHRMNGIKNFASLCINGVAAAIFIISGAVNWNLVGLMAVGAILGGAGGAGAARLLGAKRVRQFVILIGLTIGVSMLLPGRSAREIARTSRLATRGSLPQPSWRHGRRGGSHSYRASTDPQQRVADEHVEDTRAAVLGNRPSAEMIRTYLLWADRSGSTGPVSSISGGRRGAGTPPRGAGVAPAAARTS